MHAKFKPNSNEISLDFACLIRHPSVLRVIFNQLHIILDFKPNFFLVN